MEIIINKGIDPAHSRISVTYIFFILGALSGNWITRIPDVKANFALSKGTLGLVLTGAPLGAVLIMLIVGKLISIYGSKRMTIVGTLMYHITLPLIFLMPNYIVLWVFLLFVGVGTTIMDISMNSQGVEIERILGTSIMSSLHAFFSIGGVVGSVMGGIFVTLKIDPKIHLLIVSLLFLPFTIISFKYLRTEKLQPVYYKDNKRISNRQMFTSKTIWMLGIIAFIAVLGEMMMSDWSVLYLLEFNTNEANIAALGFSVFSLFMTLGRLSGDAISNRISSDKIIQICSLIASGGIFIAISTTNLIITFIGFALLGIGLSIMVPIVFKIAGNNSNIEIGSGIAGVGFFAYLAGFIEPIFIGQVADFTSSLRVSFLLVAILCLVIFFITKGINETQEHSKNTLIPAQM